MTTKISYTFIAVLLLISNKFLRAQDSTIVPGNIIVMVNSEQDTVTLIEELSQINGIKTSIRLKSVLSKKMHIYLLEFNHLSVNQQVMLDRVLSQPSVKMAQFNHRIHRRNSPDDPYFGNQWNLYNNGQNGGTRGADVDALNAWNITTGGLTAQGDTIVVAVVDEGFDLNHEDLNFWINHHEIPHNGIDDDKNGYIDDYYGWDSESRNDTLPVIAHGTMVCGIAGAKGNNAIGVAGVNWGLKIMAVSIGTTGTIADVMAAYSYVLEQRRLYNETNGAKGAFVVATNSSFGIDTTKPAVYPMWCALYDSLGSVGILSAAATSNNNYNVDSVGDMPTCCPSNWLVTVTNTTDMDAKAVNAGYGDTTIDIGAPGTDIMSTLPLNSYGVMTGTSASSPHVAGAIALMYSVGCTQFITDCKNNPAGTALIVKDSLLKAVDMLSSLKGITVSGGRLNLYKAVKAILNRYPTDNCTTLEKANTAFEITNTYPNPTYNVLNVAFNCVENCATVQATIINMLGQTEATLPIANNGTGANNCTIGLGTLTTGVYMLQLMSCGNKKSNVIKVVVY